MGRVIPFHGRIEPLPDGAILHMMGEKLRLGPDQVHAAIIHPDGSVDDLGIAHNLLTNSGRDLWAAAFGAAGVNSGTNVATGSSATSLTDSGEAWTVDQFNGTTPGTTANYAIYPTCRPRWMGLTENASAASASNTALTGEITTGGANRQLATYAHTGGTNTYTMQKTFTISASFPAIHRMGMFTASNTTAGGIMVFEAVLNADANVISGDSLQVTQTVTLSG
jgi:hypothetical protein